MPFDGNAAAVELELRQALEREQTRTAALGRLEDARAMVAGKMWAQGVWCDVKTGHGCALTWIGINDQDAIDGHYRAALNALWLALPKNARSKGYADWQRRQGDVVRYNDADRRTRGEMVRVFDRAIALLGGDDGRATG